VSANVVEIFHKGTRVASHQHSSLHGRHSTWRHICPRLTASMPSGRPSVSSSGP
jgi:hypothetical protein